MAQSSHSTPVWMIVQPLSAPTSMALMVRVLIWILPVRNPSNGRSREKLAHSFNSKSDRNLAIRARRKC